MHRRYSSRHNDSLNIDEITPHVAGRSERYTRHAALTLVLAFVVYCVSSLISLRVHTDLDNHPQSGFSYAHAERATPTSESVGVPHPFFWDIVGPAGERGHLIGTVHVPDERWERFPKALLSALDAADVLYTEVDLKDKAMMASMLMTKAQLPKGQDLKSVIGDALFQRLDAYLKSHGKSALYLNSFHPKMVEMMLGLMEIMPLLQSGKPALDEWLVQRAQSAGKMTGGVETLDEQIDALLGGTLDESIRSLEFTLRKCEEESRAFESALHKLLKVYFTGDSARVERFIKSELKGAPPGLLKSMDRLLDQRNHVMARRIVKLTRARPKLRLVFAFGVAHFVGTEGVVALLKARGYKVTRRFGPQNSAQN